jgi:signal transduction histidine kinase
MGRDEAEGRRPVGPPLGARWDAISRVAAGLSHEVRNPLNALAIHLEVLADKLKRDGGGTVPEHLQKNLAAARAQVMRIDGIVRRFADFAGAREFGTGRVEVRTLIEEAAGLCRHEVGRHGIELTVAAPAGLDLAASGPALAQALVGLVVGLADAGVGGGRLVLSARTDGEKAAIVVAEEGGGLDLSVARAAIAGEGEGRGAIERIVGEAGGEVAVEPAGTGAAVVLRLPLARRERSGAVA